MPLLPRRDDPRLAPCRVVLDYWEALRDGRVMPLRSEVDPRGLTAALDHAFILERIATGVARFRLAGLHLNAVMAMEVRGLPVTALFAPDERRAVADLVEAVFAGPETAVLDLVRDGGSEPARMVLAPLRSDLGDATRAIGCLVAPGARAEGPDRLRVRSVRRTDLLTGSETGTLPQRLAPQPPEAAPVPARAGPGHLRLVED
ncbi:MAG: PAS domain-containing protein [Hasllibacter sp.]